MFMHWRITFVLISLLCVIISCSKSTKHEDFEISPWAYEEAKLIALYLSGELEAPEDLYNQVLRELVAIRSTFGDTFEMVNRITFWPPWMVSYLLLAFHDSTARQIEAGEYEAWDELNEKYHVSEIKTEGIKHGFVSLVFEGTLNPFRLAEQYAVLPGARYAEPNYLDGDGPNVYARQTEGEITYLFRYAHGDCTAGCIYNEYWYFVFEGDRPVFVGHWIPYEDPREPRWWTEAVLNQQLYRGF